MTIVAREYREAYPRAGDVAILCEGDIVGYEAAILRKWLDTSVRCLPLVDIWPCGTSSAIYGLCDSIGRSRPILVIEDRDFRDETTAQKDCRDNEKDRQQRGVQILGWRTWRRNEIENYFLEPEVLYPVMADAFHCKDAGVAHALSELVPSLAMYQCVQDVLYHARKTWSSARLAIRLVPGVDAWPRWNDENHSLGSRAQDEVRDELVEVLSRLPGALDKKRNKWAAQNLLERFDEKQATWSKVDIDDPVWRLDWCGKEILQLLRIYLTSRYGWLDSSSGVRVKMSWQDLKRRERDAQDRPIEAALRPALVRRLLEHISEAGSEGIMAEFVELRDLLSAWKSHL